MSILAFLFFSLISHHIRSEQCNSQLIDLLRIPYKNFQNRLKLFTSIKDINNETCLFEVDQSMQIKIRLSIPELVDGHCELRMVLTKVSTTSISPFAKTKSSYGDTFEFVESSPFYDEKFERSCMEVLSNETNTKRLERIKFLVSKSAEKILYNIGPVLMRKGFLVLIGHVFDDKQNLKVALFNVFVDVWREQLDDTFLIYEANISQFFVEYKETFTNFLVSKAEEYFAQMKESLATKLSDWTANLAETIVTKVTSYQAKQAEKSENLIERIFPGYRQKIRFFMIEILNSFESIVRKLFDYKKVLTSINNAYISFKNYTKGAIYYLIGSTSWTWMTCQSNDDPIYKALINASSTFSSNVPLSCLFQPKNSESFIYVIEFSEKSGEKCELRFLVSSEIDETVGSPKQMRLLDDGYNNAKCNSNHIVV